MREIKFRAWHPTNKVMHIFDLIKAASDVYIAQHFIELLNNTHCEGSDLLMQYTGLKDKNGAEIYESCEIDNRYFVEKSGCEYVLLDISSGDTISLQQYYNENKNGFEVTREYIEI